MYEASVIFEGGGMRGGYSTGVIDAFLDNDIEFSSIYAVSAGACHATSFVSRQRGRAYRLSTDYLHDRDYCSFSNLIKTGTLFGRDMMFHRFHVELDPFDFDTFAAYPGNFYAVVTNMRTGQAEYLRLQPDSPRRQFPEVCASCSIPLLARIVSIKGEEYLDGFVGDSIPIRKSIADGNRKNVLVLTRPAFYRKGVEKAMPIIRLKYRKYPNFVASYRTRAYRYNETLDFIAEEEKKGNLFVIRPRENLSVGMVTKNLAKLKKIYDLGYEDTCSRMDELKTYLCRL